MQTLTSQYGREPLVIDDEIPTVALRDLLGWMHVSTSDEHVEAWVREKVGHRFTPVQEEQTVKAALWLHAENRALYRWVQNGLR